MAKKLSGITIAIGADASGLDKALSDVNTKASKTTKELKEVEKALKFNPDNTELLAQKQKLLSDQVATTKEKLDKLKEAEAQVQEQFKKGEISQEQYREFQRELIETESKLKHYEKQLKSASTEKNKFSESIDKASEKLKSFGGKMGEVGEDLSKKVTAPLVGVGIASMKAFTDVDDALDTIVTKTGATGDEMKKFETNFKNVAQNMPAELQSVGDAIGEVNTQFALTGKELEKASEQILKFSEINGQDVTSSTIASKGAMEAYGLEAKDLSSVLDAVTKTAQNTGVSTDKIFDSVTKGAPQLRALGLDFAQSAEVMGRFEQTGIDSSKALSYLSRSRVIFAKEGKTLDDGLAELTEKIKNSSSETEQLSLASEYFGTKGATFMLDAINRGALEFEDFANASESASGSVSATWEGILDPIDRLKIATNNLKILGAEIALSMQETLEPILKNLIERLKGIIDKFSALSPETKEMIVKIGLLAAAIGPMLIIGGKVATGIGSIISLTKVLIPIIAGLSAPVLITIGVITALVAAGVLLYKNWDYLKEKAQQLGTFLQNTWENIKNFTADLFKKIGEVMLFPITKTVDLIKQTIDGLKNFFSNIKLKALEIPKPKIPKFKLTGEFSLKPPSVPRIDIEWNAQGAIFTKPYVFGNQGVGEAGPEAVLPLSKLAGMMAETLDKMNVSKSYNNNETTIINQYAPPQQVNNLQIGAEKVGTVIAPTVTYNMVTNRSISGGGFGA